MFVSFINLMNNLYFNYYNHINDLIILNKCINFLTICYSLVFSFCVRLKFLLKKKLTLFTLTFRRNCDLSLNKRLYFH